MCRGSPRALEEELRAKGSRLRTLIKSGGLWYPNVNVNTSSYFRVDRMHNKVSLVSMFGPSPDWVVGKHKKLSDRFYIFKLTFIRYQWVELMSKRLFVGRIYGY